jgi:putative tricarboxylic transport membrane protein
VCGGILVWRGFASGELKSDLVAIAPWVRDRYLLTNVVIALALIIAYVLLDDYVGFAPLAFAILMVLFLRFGVRPLRGAVIAAFTVLFIHLTFVTLLRVPLPGGLIDRLLW